MTTTLHLAVAGSDLDDGSEDHPRRTIGKAAALAQPGDTVLVHVGAYREWVKPARGGLSDTRRITYAAVPGDHDVIKGSERITGWEINDGTVWRVRLPAAVFGEFIPFAVTGNGGWVAYATLPPQASGEVYLDGSSSYEVHSLVTLANPCIRSEMVDHWTGATVAIGDPEQTRFVWYAEVVDQHIDFISVRGFELAQAACPWTPPTADQSGLCLLYTSDAADE